LRQTSESYPARRILKSLSSLIVPDGKEFLSGQRSMKVVVSKEGRTEAIKTFSLPEGSPFIISQNKFQVVERINLPEGIRRELRAKGETAKGEDSLISRYRATEGSVIGRIKSITPGPIGGMKKTPGGKRGAADDVGRRDRNLLYLFI